MKEETKIKVNEMIEIFEKWDASTISEDNAKINRIYNEVKKINNFSKGKFKKHKALTSAIYQANMTIKSLKTAGIPTDDEVEKVKMYEKELIDLNYKKQTRPKKDKKNEPKKELKVASSTNQIRV